MIIELVFQMIVFGRKQTFGTIYIIVSIEQQGNYVSTIFLFKWRYMQLVYGLADHNAAGLVSGGVESSLIGASRSSNRVGGVHPRLEAVFDATYTTRSWGRVTPSELVKN